MRTNPSKAEDAPPRATPVDTAIPSVREDESTPWPRPPPAQRVDLVARTQLLQQVQKGLFSEGVRSTAPTLRSRYRLTELLGAGGMGVVYSAHDPVLEREVAIKFVRAGSAVATQDLLREARALARLAHPNVVPVYDVADYDPGDFEALGLLETDGFEPTFVVMERVQGTTLSRWLEAEPRSRSDVVRVFLQAATGLAAAHAVGVVHRDFKPSNVMVSEAGRARVLDFGLARRVGESLAVLPDDGALVTTDGSDAERTLVKGGMVVGTPAYMAPEQHAGGHGDARSDQYSYCVALCEAMTRTALFRGRSVSDVAREKASGPVRIAKSARVPRRLRAIIRRGTAPDPAQRFDSMEALAAALESVLNRRRRWVLFGVASFLGGTALAVSIPEPDPRDCDAEAAAAIASAWNDDKRDSLARAFALSGASYAQASWATTRAELDAFAQRWVARRASECRVETAGEAREGQAECLDSQRDYVAALVEVLGRGDAEVVASAVSLLEFLPRMDDCNSSQRRSAHRIEATTHALARARVLEDSGESVGARSVLSEELTMHGETPSPSSAALLLMRAAVALRAGHPEPAEADANRAWEFAEHSGDTQLASRAMIALVSVRRAQARFPEAASLLAVLAARASAEGPASVLGARVLTERAQIAWNRGDGALAVTTLEQAAEAWTRVRGPHAEALSTIRTTQAVALARAGDADTAVSLLEELYEEQRTRLGDGHPSLARIDLDLATVLRAARFPLRAQRHLRRAVDSLAAEGMQDRLEMVDALEQAASLELDLGHTIAAERFAVELVAAQTQRLGEGHPQLVDAYSVLALARSLRGSPGAAEQALVRAEAAHNASPEKSAVMLGLIQALRCDVQMQLGEADAGVESCRSAVSAWSSEMPEHSTTALLRMMYAVALAQIGQVDKARLEVEAARRVLDGPDVPVVARAQGTMLEGELWLSTGQLGAAMDRFDEARRTLLGDPESAPAEWVRIHLRMATVAGLHGDRLRAEGFAQIGSEFALQRGVEVEVAAACHLLLAAVLRPVNPRASRLARVRGEALWKRLGSDSVVVREHEAWTRSVVRALR